jgi:hypothetical protein
MKRFALIMAVLAAGAMAAFALEDVTLPQGGAFYDGVVNETARAALSNNITVAYTAAITAQADTNVTTAVKSYTPRRVGDLLVGGAGATTNGVWVSKGATTNDWVQVAP